MFPKIYFIALAIFLSNSSFAGEGEYAVSKIPVSLLRNAHAIKRFEKISFEIVSTGEAILKKKYALTILDEKGDGQAGFAEYYDKLHEIKNIEGALYDAEGKELKRLKNKQVIDLSGGDNNNLADDNRRKFHHFYHRVYPYTVEYEVEVKYDGTLFFPVWLPREDDDYSVEQSSISIIFPQDYTIRYKAFNYTGVPITVVDKSRKIMTWEAKELPAISREFASPDWLELNTAVFFGPSRFEIEKFQGNMNSWLEFGKFVYSLKQGRDQLPDNIRQLVHQLTGQVKDTKEKIRVLYEYMQKNTRYISIQLGIGGWQPYDAKYVAAKSYGDCKALSNYMYSLLKEAGINSYYTLIKAGANATDLILDFPSQQFNHVILCVPLQNDTLWLECTSQTAPAGYMGSFTGNRNALLIDEQGGHLVRTPWYGLDKNLQLRKISGVVNAAGTLALEVKTRYEGLQQDNLHGLINDLAKDKVKEVLHDQLDFATYDISNFSYRETKTALPAIDESLTISVTNYATITGKRLFIVPNIMTKNNRKLAADYERKNDIVFNVAYKDVDTAVINLPEGYTVESMPQDVSLTTLFGKYNCSVKLSGTTLYYYRSIEMYDGRFAAGNYGALVKFYQAIYKADRNKVVLVKKETVKGF